METIPEVNATHLDDVNLTARIPEFARLTLHPDYTMGNTLQLLLALSGCTVVEN